MTLDPRIAAIIAAAAQRYGQDPAYLQRQAVIESGGNPSAQNPHSSAGGLFQFTNGTAAQYGLANKLDPAASSDAAARLARDNGAYLMRQLGRDPTPGELYLAHQQGMGGAAKLLSQPDARAADLVGLKAVTGNGGTPDMTAGQFAGRWTGKFDGPAMTLPGEPAKAGAFGFSGPVATDAPAAPKVVPSAPDDSSGSLDIMKLLQAFQPQQAAPAAIPSPAPAVTPRAAAPPAQFDASTFYALLNGRPAR